MTDRAPAEATATRAGVWTVSGKFAAKLIDFALLLILGRILVPADFGLIAMAMAPLFIVEAVFDFPLAQAIISHRKPVQTTYDTAFTLGVIRGVVVGIILFLLAAPIATFFDEPRLVLLIRVLSLAPIFRGLQSPRLADFMRRMDFRPEFAMDLIGKTVAFGAAIILAFSLRSYWAIAAATIIAPIVMTIVSFVIAPHRPRYSTRDTRHFVDILGWTTVSQVLRAANWQIDRILLGRTVSPTALGQYSLGQEFSSLAHQVVGRPMAKPIMADLSRRRDADALQSTLLDYIAGLFTLIGPIAVGIALLADPLIRTALGPGWEPAIPVLRALSALYLLMIPTLVLGPLALSLNRTRSVAVATLSEAAIKLPLMIWLVASYGIPGAVAAIGLARLATWLIVARLVRHLSGLGILRQLAVLIAPSLALLVMAVGVWAVSPDWSALGLGVRLGAMLGLAGGGALIYVGTLTGLWVLRGRPDGMEAKVIQSIRRRTQRPPSNR